MEGGYYKVIPSPSYPPTTFPSTVSGQMCQDKYVKSFKFLWKNVFNRKNLF